MTVDTINEEVRSNNIQRIHHLEFHVGNAMHVKICFNLLIYKWLINFFKSF